jgi:hypothetical protein
MQTLVPSSVNDARQVARIAGRFPDLLGLRQAVGGVGLLLMFAWEMIFPLSLADIRRTGIQLALWGLVVAAVGVAVLVLSVLWVSAWYRRRYGLVERSRKRNRLAGVLGASGALAFLIPFEVDIFTMNYGHVLPANLAVFTLALWIVAYWLYLGRPFWHYLVLAGIGIGLGLASIAGLPPNTFAGHLRETTLYFAIASIAGGVIDHMILTRSLSRLGSPVGFES